MQIVNSAIFPYTTVVIVRSYFPDGTTASGSGVVVGRNDVLTASHVVYDLRYGGLAEWTKVVSGYTPSNPMGSFGEFIATDVLYFDTVSDGSVAYSGDNKPNSLAGAEADVALLSFDVPIGDMTGMMSIDYGFSAGNLKVSGYPSSSGFQQTLDSGYSYIPTTTPDSYLYTGGLSTSPGNSGGPLWYASGGQRYVAGVVSTENFGAALSGHSHWLPDAMLENNDLIAGIPVSPVSAPGGNITFGSTNDTVQNPFLYDGLNMGGGVDTLIFDAYNSSDVGISVSSNSVTISHSPSSQSVVITDGERFEFSDRTLAFDESGNAGQAYRLYQAAFDRTPDEGGLGFWINELETGRLLKNVSNAFVNSAEFKVLFGSNTTNSQFVDALYNNVLNRSPDPDGAVFWETSLITSIDRADLLIAFAESAENKSLTSSAFDDGVWFS